MSAKDIQKRQQRGIKKKKWRKEQRKTANNDGNTPSIRASTEEMIVGRKSIMAAVSEAAPVAARIMGRTAGTMGFITTSMALPPMEPPMEWSSSNFNTNCAPASIGVQKIIFRSVTSEKIPI